MKTKMIVSNRKKGLQLGDEGQNGSEEQEKRSSSGLLGIFYSIIQKLSLIEASLYDFCNNRITLYVIYSSRRL